MRLGTIRSGGGTQAVRVTDRGTFLLPFRDVGRALANTSRISELAELGVAGPATDEVRWAPPVTRPGKIICVGLNYRTHILEMGREVPRYPTLFAKFAESLIGSRDEIWLPAASEAVDWEAELAVVIGRVVRHADARGAAAAIAGYTVANDISMRDFQRRTGEWLQGKTFEHSTPLGPLVVTPDEVDHAADLRITCSVDGAERQASRTSDLLFSPAELVSYLSFIVPLAPGDVLLTGTPGGVGAGMNPPAYLAAGQVVTASIEGIGSCVNTCVVSGAPASGSAEKEIASVQ